MTTTTTTTSTAGAITEATIEAPLQVPTIVITRDFAASPEHVFRAWTEQELVAQWLGPNSTEMDLHEWDARTGGSYRYSAKVGGEVVASFYGSFHEVRPSERIVWTFTFEGAPDGVSLETITFDDLGDGRTRVTTVSVVDTFETRDLILSSGMEVGVHEGYAKLDGMLAAG